MEASRQEIEDRQNNTYRRGRGRGANFGDFVPNAGNRGSGNERRGSRGGRGRGYRGNCDNIVKRSQDFRENSNRANVDNNKEFPELGSNQYRGRTEEPYLNKDVEIKRYNNNNENNTQRNIDSRPPRGRNANRSRHENEQSRNGGNVAFSYPSKPASDNRNGNRRNNSYESGGNSRGNWDNGRESKDLGSRDKFRNQDSQNNSEVSYGSQKPRTLQSGGLGVPPEGSEGDNKEKMRDEAPQLQRQDVERRGQKHRENNVIKKYGETGNRGAFNDRGKEDYEEHQERSDEHWKRAPPRHSYKDEKPEDNENSGKYKCQTQQGRQLWNTDEQKQKQQPSQYNDEETNSYSRDDELCHEKLNTNDTRDERYREKTNREKRIEQLAPRLRDQAREKMVRHERHKEVKHEHEGDEVHEEERDADEEAYSRDKPKRYSTQRQKPGSSLLNLPGEVEGQSQYYEQQMYNNVPVEQQYITSVPTEGEDINKNMKIKVLEQQIMQLQAQLYQQSLNVAPAAQRGGGGYSVHPSEMAPMNHGGDGPYNLDPMYNGLVHGGIVPRTTLDEVSQLNPAAVNQMLANYASQQQTLNPGGLYIPPEQQMSTDFDYQTERSMRPAAIPIREPPGLQR